MSDAKTYLQQIKRLDAIINSKQEDLDWLNGIATKMTSSLGGEAVSGTRDQDKTGDVVAKIADLRTEINNDIDKLVDKRREIKSTIEKLQNADQIKVLLYFYVGVWNQAEDETRYLTWREIADKIHVSEKTVQRIHGSALCAIEKLIKPES